MSDILELASKYARVLREYNPYGSQRYLRPLEMEGKRSQAISQLCLLPNALEELYSVFNGVHGTTPEERRSHFIPGKSLCARDLVLNRIKYDNTEESNAVGSQRIVFMTDWHMSDLYAVNADNLGDTSMIYIEDVECGLDDLSIFDSMESLLRTATRWCEANLWYDQEAIDRTREFFEIGEQLNPRSRYWRRTEAE